MTVKVSDAKRSTVDTLQEFYAIVVGLALTSGFEKFVSLLTQREESGDIWPIVAIFVAFLSTVIPFYHGMNRHLYVSHVEMSVLGEKGKPFPLLADVFVFVVEAGILFGMGRVIDSPETFFYLWISLLFVDIVWSLGVWSFQRFMAPKWALNNFVWILIAFFLWPHSEDIFGALLTNQNVLLVVVAEVARSFIDYLINWNFYFPKEPAQFQFKPITYLAGPYSKGGFETRKARFEAITAVAAQLIEDKRVVYSPITMTHPIDLVISQDKTDLGSDFWVQFDEQFMNSCSEILVLRLPGWDDSSGVKKELQFFRRKGIEPQYLDPQSFGVTPDKPLFSAAFDLQ